MHPTAQTFRDRAREQFDFDPDIHELPSGTRTAADAAAAVDCHLAQIAKSMVMRVDHDLVLVLTSGTKQVDKSRLAQACDVEVEAIDLAAPEVIKEVTGWTIGGVPPIAHDSPLRTIIDPTLLTFDEVWAGGGTPSAVFPVDPNRLVEMTDAEQIDVFDEE